MKVSKPPALATWMLENLVVGDTDALVGDLLEEFERRDSAGWYWRQVFAAIIASVSRELSHQWKAFGFALVWSFVETVILAQWFNSAIFQSIHPWTLRYQAPEAYFLFMGAEILLHVLITWFGLVVYLALMGALDAQRLTRGQLICLFFIALDLAVRKFCWGFVLRVTPPSVFRVVVRIPTVIALTASLWATLPSAATKRARIRISD